MDIVSATNHHVRDTSLDKGIDFPSYAYFIYTDRTEYLSGFGLFCNLTYRHMPGMKFLFVRTDVCR